MAVATLVSRITGFIRIVLLAERGHGVADRRGIAGTPRFPKERISNLQEPPPALALVLSLAEVEELLAPRSPPLNVYAPLNLKGQLRQYTGRAF